MNILFFCLSLSAFAETSAPAPATSPEPAPVAKKEESLKIDAGQAKLNLLLQMWGLTDSTATTAKNNFRARRAEIKFSGTLNEKTRWLVMVDPTKSLSTGQIAATNDNKVLQDLSLSYLFTEQLEATVGQFKILTVAESLDSSGDLPLPERSLLARALGDKRQLGMQLAYKEPKWRIAAMLSNGGRANTDDTTTAKDFSARADFLPFSGFGVGGFVAANEVRFGENGKYGANLRWKGEKELLRFEFAFSDDTVSGVKTKSKGYAADTGFYVLPNLQPVLRFERFQPNQANGTVSKATHLGLNYFLQKNNSKLQLSYSLMSNMRGSNGSYISDLTVGRGRLFVLAYQVSL